MRFSGLILSKFEKRNTSQWTTTYGTDLVETWTCSMRIGQLYCLSASIYHNHGFAVSLRRLQSHILFEFSIEWKLRNKFFNWMKFVQMCRISLKLPKIRQAKRQVLLSSACETHACKLLWGLRRPIKMTKILLHACTIMQYYIIALWWRGSRLLYLIWLKWMFLCRVGGAEIQSENESMRVYIEIEMKHFLVVEVVVDGRTSSIHTELQTYT